MLPSATRSSPIPKDAGSGACPVTFTAARTASAIEVSVGLHAFALASTPLPPTNSVKVSATPGLSREPYPWRDAAVHIKRVFDAYGLQRSYWGTDLTNTYAKGSYRQRITHFTEELSFLSETDKDWVMGRAILRRLNWS